MREGKFATGEDSEKACGRQFQQIGLIFAFT